MTFSIFGIRVLVMKDDSKGYTLNSEGQLVRLSKQGEKNLWNSVKKLMGYKSGHVLSNMIPLIKNLRRYADVIYGHQISFYYAIDIIKRHTEFSERGERIIRK